ncbi:hypothetical protein ASZ78_008897 [Callipepla squamata]|uniref:Uncharacterized protein n=1 Tax=Callipepla squamata TaxID=9009 RepID=A0A226N5V0_CALSU|nr:hypothetical protein ASZ78_008897 [Callipepla squamata]
MSRGRNGLWCLNTEGKAASMMDLKIFISFLALKKAFAENEEIQEMAQDNFIMLNLMVERVWGGLIGSSFCMKPQIKTCHLMDNTCLESCS